MHYDMYMESAATKGKTMSKQATTDGFYARQHARIEHARETRLTYEQRAWLDTHLVNAYPDGDGMRYQRSNGYGGKSAQLKCVGGKWLLIEELAYAEYTQCTTREMPTLRAGLLAMVEYLATL